MKIDYSFYFGIGLGVKKDDDEWFLLLPFVVIGIRKGE